MSQTMRPSSQRAAEVETMAKSLQQENDILRFQLNDLISREKNQRLELQRLRAHRDVEVSALVNASTQKLKGEVEHVKGLLEPTSSSLAQALSDKEKAISAKDQAVSEMEKLRKRLEDEEATVGGRCRSLETAISKSTALAATILQQVEAFQKHVLPNFRVIPNQINKSQKSCDSNESYNKILEELQKLEAGIAILRVIVDAKNDTLVLIRGKLKQENDELKAELTVARDKKVPSNKQTAPLNDQAQSCADQVGLERNLLRQEIHALQDLYNAKFKQLQSKLKAYEQAEILHQDRYGEIRQECQSLQSQLTTIEASRGQLEVSLKDETTARAQLVSELFQFRKENDTLRAELDMMKVNQKFFGGHARRGRVSMEKMDLINTVNQLLLENSKLKSDKVALEEEVKTQRRTNVLERVKSVVTARDVAFCANNKVGESELASKLARVRLQHLGQGSSTHFALTNGNPGLSMAMINPYVQSDTPRSTSQDSLCDDTTTKEVSRTGFVQAPTTKRILDLYETGQTGLAQLAGLRERGIIST